MNKNEFISELKKGLSGLSESDVEERLSFYSEIIDDRMEEGMSESDAVAAAGPVDEVISRILADVPLSRIVKEKMSRRRSPSGREIALLVLGFPLWFPLLIAAAAVILSLYLVLWALVISLWAIELSLIVCALCGIAAAVVFFIRGRAIKGVALLGAALICAGLSVFLCFGCVAASKGAVRLAGKCAVGIKKMFMRKGKDE